MARASYVQVPHSSRYGDILSGSCASNGPPAIRQIFGFNIYSPADQVNARSLSPLQAFFSTDACMAVAFQLGIDNTSPAITYSPFFPNAVALNATAGWTPYYTFSGFPSTSGLVGDGTSLQISSNNGSFFSITWFGASPFSPPRKSPSRLTFDRFRLHRHWHRSLRKRNPCRVRNQFGPRDWWRKFWQRSGQLGLKSPRLVLKPTTRHVYSHSNRAHFVIAVFIYSVRRSGYYQRRGRGKPGQVSQRVKIYSHCSFVASVTIRSETVDDASIAYRGSWSFQESTIPGGYIHVTNQLGDSAQLTFNGKGIYLSSLHMPQLTLLEQEPPSLSLVFEIPQLAITTSPWTERRRNTTPSQHGNKRAPCCFT